MKQKTHQFVVTVTFDKPCGAGYARKEVADCIHGDFYPAQYESKDPGVFHVRSFKPLPSAARGGNI